jgi:hypothetical protein
MNNGFCWLTKMACAVSEVQVVVLVVSVVNRKPLDAFDREAAEISSSWSKLFSKRFVLIVASLLL